MQAKRFRHLNIAIIAALISGCGLLGPNYKKPNVGAPSDWNSGKSNTAESATLMSDTAWWTQFNDPVLNQMIVEALANNNNIQVAIGNIYQAKAQLEKVKMSWVPTITMGGGGLVGQTFNQSITPDNAALSNFATTNSQNFNAAYGGFMPVYSFNIFQLIKREDVAKLNLKMQEASKNAVRLSVISQVAGGYFTLLSLHKRLELENQMIADAVEARKYTLVQIANGSASEIDLQEIDQFLETISAQLPSIEDNIVQTQNALQVLLNKNPATLVANNDFDNIRTDGIIPVNLPSAVLQNRPDIIQAEYEVQISNAKIGVAMSQFFPNISLTSPVGAASFALNNLFSGSVDFWAAQVMASMPLLNLGIYSDIKQAKASYYSDYYNYIQTVRDAFSQVDNGLSKHQSVDKAYKRQLQAYNAAQRLYNLQQVQYKNGAASYANTLNYKLNVDNSAISVNQAKMNQLTSIVNLYQALGGGYNVNNTESENKFGDGHDW